MKEMPFDAPAIFHFEISRTAKKHKQSPSLQGQFGQSRQRKEKHIFSNPRNWSTEEKRNGTWEFSLLILSCMLLILP